MVRISIEQAALAVGEYELFTQDRKAVAVVDESAEDLVLAVSLGELDQGRGDAFLRLRAWFRGVKIGAFAEIPAKMLAAVLRKIDFLDVALANVANAQPVAKGIVVDVLGITQTICPDFRQSFVNLAKGIATRQTVAAIAGVVADRIERVADAVGDPRRVLACSDCGFDTSAGMGRVTSDIVWAKLAAMSAGAKIATERLF